MKKTAIAFVCSALFIAGSVYAAWQVSRARNFQFFGDLVPRVGMEEKMVALTFDDAPASRTREVLDILRDKGVRGTFFMIGSLLEKDPGAGKDIYEAGHELGNHSYSHTRMVLKRYAFIRSEVERTDELIRRTGYSGEIHFRPPFGKKFLGLPWYLASTERTTVMWDVEPESFADVAGDAVLIEEHVLANARPGSIVLLHGMCDSESCAETRKALPRIIDRLREEGYGFVTVSELMERVK